MTARCSTTISLDCDHSPFLSMPSTIADILTQVANG